MTSVDLKVPIRIVDEFEEDQVDATGQLNLAQLVARDSEHTSRGNACQPSWPALAGVDATSACGTSIRTAVTLYSGVPVTPSRWELVTLFRKTLLV